jgi:outer membrane receptor protein involved in Fe transport
LKGSRKRQFLWATGLTTLGLQAPAQQSTLPAAASQLEEIVVTAEKRAEPLQDVPLAVSALPASLLRDAGVVSMQGVAGLVPSLFVNNVFSQIVISEDVVAKLIADASYQRFLENTREVGLTARKRF